MKLKWDRTTISASEVNRYTYCPYQWYFERYYGRSKLFQMSKTKKAEPQIAPTAKTKSKTTAAKTRESHFARGRAYHAKEYQNFRRKQRIFLFCVAVVVIILIVCIFILLIK